MPRKKEERKKDREERRKRDFIGEDIKMEQNENVEELNFENEEQWEVMASEIEDAISFLGERRDKGNIIREVLLEKIIYCLRHSYLPDFLQTQKDELLRILSLAIYSQSQDEQIQTCLIVSLLCVICDNWKFLYNQFAPHFKRIIISSENYLVKSLAVDSLGICSLMFKNEEFSDKVEHLLYFGGLLNENEDIKIDKVTSCYFQSCLNMWGLIASTLDEYIVDIIPDYIETIIKLLYCKEIEVRMVAGETLALISSIVAKSEIIRQKEYSPYYFAGYFDVDDVLKLLHSTDTHQERKVSKKSSELQRHGFNDFLSSFEYGTSPVDIITINGQQFTFSSWSSIKKLSCIRNLLGSGFLTHMLFNPSLSKVFNIEIPQNTLILSKFEKQQLAALSSFESKDRTLMKKAGRKAKQRKMEQHLD